MFGVGAMSFAIGLIIGMVIPRGALIDNLFTQVYLLVVLLLSISSLVSLLHGLKK